MKAPIRTRGKALCMLLGVIPFLAVSVHSAEIDRTWVDDTWRDHILWRAEVLAGKGPNNAYAESFCREVLKYDPDNLRALNILTEIYAMKGESALLAATSLIALDLKPGDGFWVHTLKQADERIATKPLAPTDEELVVATNKFTVYLQEAIRTRQVDRNLLISEVALRALLIDYPLNVNLLQEMSQNLRLGREWTLCAAVNQLGLRAYPENRGFLYNLLQSLRLMGRADIGWPRVREEIAIHPDEPELLELAAVLSVDAGLTNELAGVIASVTASDTNADRLVSSGRRLIGNRELAAAVPMLIAAHAAEPARHEPVYDLAIVNSIMGDNEQALRWLGLLKDRVPAGQYETMLQDGPFSETVKKEAR